MGLADLEGKRHEELSLAEVVRTILEGHGKRMVFAGIVNAVQEYLGTSDEEIRGRSPRFYTDTNTDGELISMGDNVWVLHSWFLYKSVDEEINHPEDEDSEPRRKYHRKVSVFIASSDGDDIIDYDSDNPEDDDLDTEDGDNVDDFDAADDDDFDDTGDSDELPDSIEGQLSELGDEDDESDE